jgi:glycosyltransferase involved in cell wall biosynthesis
MRIGIEAERANMDHPTGVEHYAQQMILSFVKLDQDNQYVLYLRTKPKDWIKSLPKNFTVKVMPFPLFWTQLRISWEMLVNPPDVLFIMASALPFIHPKNSVVTIHDLAWKFYPETFTKSTRSYLEFSTAFAVRHAKKVIAVSEQTRQDILHFYKVPPEKVRTIYHGFDASSEIQMKNNQEELDEIAKLPSKFILYLGTLQPRKNIDGLIDALRLLQREDILKNYKLVIAGGKGWLYDRIIKRIEGNKDIIYFGYVNDRFAFLKRASMLVQPAFYEGFGLQILDAFYAGVPVACSNISSLPEVAGDAAKYFDPKDPGDIARAISALIEDPDLRASLIALGQERLKQFTWSSTAERTLSVLMEK